MTFVNNSRDEILFPLDHAGFRKERLDKVITNARLSGLVKQPAGLKVGRCVLKDDNRHDFEARKRALNCANVRNFASPRSARAFLSLRISACHCGEGISFTSRQSASQSCSMACNRSAMDI